MRVTAQLVDGTVHLTSEVGLDVTLDSPDDALNLAVGLITCAQEADPR